MTPRDALLRAIAVNRFDWLPRLVFADYLDETGDPVDAALAEFVRVGCALAEAQEYHRPASWCDCERCRLVRRQTILADSGAGAGSLRVDGLLRLGFRSIGISHAAQREGFPSAFDGGTLAREQSPAELPLMMSRLFLLLPVLSASAEFLAWRNMAESGRWRVMVNVSPPAAGCGLAGVRVVGQIGAMVRGRFHHTFGCQYRVSALARIPTLVRKAVRRCLTNRTANGENRPAPPTRRHAVDLDAAA